MGNPVINLPLGMVRIPRITMVILDMVYGIELTTLMKALYNRYYSYPMTSQYPPHTTSYTVIVHILL